MRVTLLILVLPSCHLILPLEGSSDSRAGADLAAGDLGLAEADTIPKTDTMVNTGPPPCAPGVEVHQTYPSDMVMCFGSLVDQCSASTLCAFGWHLCTASEYRTQADKPARTAAWIAGCVRDGDDVQAPSEAPCACKPKTGDNEKVHWQCGGGVAGRSSYEHVGVMSWSKCNSVGADGWEGLWISQPAVFNLKAAMCCS